MAAIRANNVIIMGTSGDAITGKLFIQALHATGEVAGITDTAGNAVAAFAAEDTISFPDSLLVDGIIRGTGAGVLYVYLS